MSGDLLFDPPFPAPLILVVALVVAAVAAAVYVRARVVVGARAFLWTLRLLAIAGLAIVLLRPMAIEPSSESAGKPAFVVLVDTSASMNTPDTDEGTRLDTVRARLSAAEPALLQQMGRRYDVFFAQFSGDVLPSTLAGVAGARADGLQTDIGAALVRTVDQRPNGPWAGLLVLSDGRENAGEGAERAAAYLKSRGVPVWAAPVGTEAQAKDLFLSAWMNQPFLFVRQPGKIRVTIAQTGYPDGYARVNLYREGVYASSQQVTFKGGAARVEFPIQEPAKGVYQFRVEVEPLQGEADLRNNRRSVFARVVDEKSRVLVVEGRPSWDTKFLLRALRSDPNLEVTSLFYVTQDRPFVIEERAAGGLRDREPLARMPQRTEDLDKYDCIVFGRDADALLTAEDLARLRAFIADRGGSVVFARGRPYGGEHAELAAIEPVTWGEEDVEDIRLQLTPEGRGHPMFSFEGTKPADVVIRELPELTSVTKVREEKSLAVILAETAPGAAPEEMAVVGYQRYGKGKVMSIGSAGLWRWSFLPERMAEYDAVYAQFWGQMMRWLLSESDFLPGQRISFKVDKQTFRLGETVRLSVWTRDVDPAAYKPSMEILPEEGPPLALTPVRAEGDRAPYVASFTPDTEGEYTAVLHNNTGEPQQELLRFAVYSDTVETRLVAADPGLLASVAAATGGCEIPIDDLGQLPGKVRQYEVSATERAKPIDLWDRPAVFATLVALLSLEWLIRRRKGMV